LVLLLGSAGGALLSLPQPASASAPTPVELEAIRAAKRAVAVRIQEPIRVDGVLDESAWAQAEPAVDFFQKQPDEFEPASRRTEVRFLYDDTTLYVGATLYDEATEQLIINDLKRDFAAPETDSFGLILDTFKDRRNAYGFLANPGGALRDTQAFDNGRRNDPNWHAAWVGRTAIGADAWTVEFAIPFRSLRFPDRAMQDWGLNMMRVVRRTNEVTTWSPVPRQFSHYAVAYAGTLGGLANVQGGRDLRVKPFLTGQVTQGIDAAGWARDGDGGVDLKWGVTSSLVLDGTYRTDFSQVEADEQQINLTRFGLFFPEKREFFLENPAAFQIGLADGEADDQRRDIVPFFSRRIGLSTSGQPIPVVGGARLTGRAGGIGVGLLSMRTEAFDGRPADTFTAARLTRNIHGNGAVGAFYFGRNPAGAGGANQVTGVDLRLRPRPTLEIEAFGMRSHTDDARAGLAGRAGFRLDASAHRARLGLVHVDDTFQHDLGFVRQRGVGLAFGRYARVFRPADTAGPVREHSLEFTFDFTGDDHYRHLLTRMGRLEYQLLFTDGGSLSGRVTTNFERLDESFGIGSDLTIQPGRYWFEDAGVEYSSNRSAMLSGGIEVEAGEFWTGRRRTLNGNLRFRFDSHFAVSGTLSRNDVDLPQGSFLGTLAGFRVDWSLTPRMFMNAFIQYNGETDTWLSNVRFNLMHRPLSDVYLVWNETRLPGETRRALLFKYTHLIAF
jgi:hypothetical protein